MTSAETPNPAFEATEDWPLQAFYKERLHRKIARWGLRVAPALEALPEAERTGREAFFAHLVTSVERGDKRTATLVESLDNYADGYYRDGPYGNGGSGVESPAGISMCQSQFESLYTIYQAGQQSVEQQPVQ